MHLAGAHPQLRCLHAIHAQEFQAWADEVGFTSTQLIHLAGPTSAAVAYK